MTVQDIVTAVSVDMRKMLDSQGADATLILGWVDRVHKDCLHSSFYSFMNQTSVSVATQAGIFDYPLPSNTRSIIRRILLVYDRTFNRILLPMDSMSGTKQGEQEGEAISDSQLYPSKVNLSAKTMSPFPEYYKYTDESLYLFPAPASAAFAGGLDVHFEKRVANLSALNTALILPDDAKDMVVAGVNELTAMYLKRGEEAAYWHQLYEQLKKGEVIA